jgi:hypothetical protein
MGWKTGIKRRLRVGLQAIGSDTMCVDPHCVMLSGSEASDGLVRLNSEAVRDTPCHAEAGAKHPGAGATCHAEAGAKHLMRPG